MKPHDLSRVNAAFFTVNGYVSFLFFVFWAADILLHRRYAITKCSMSTLLTNTPCYRRPAFETDLRKSRGGRAAQPCEDGVAMFRSPDLLALGYLANLVRETHAWQHHVLQRQPAYQSDRCLRGQLPVVRIRQESERSATPTLCRSSKCGSRAGEGWSGSGHRVSHCRRTASGIDARLVLRDVPRAEGAVSARSI